MIHKFLHFICAQCYMAWKEVVSSEPGYSHANTTFGGVCPRCGLRNTEPVDTSEKEVPSGR